VPDDRRRLLLRAALGFLQLVPRAPELRLVHRWLDTWTGGGLIVVGVERGRGSPPMFAPAAVGVAALTGGMSPSPDRKLAPYG
jgi:hypothetical protein